LKITDRLPKLRRGLTERGVDALLISQPENRYYLSGFSGSAGFLLITPQDAVLATDSRYTEQARTQATDYKLFQIAGDTADWLPELVAGLNIRRLGFEAGYITFATYQQFSDILSKAQPRLNLIPVDGLVESLRAIKEPGEIELITRAVELTDKLFEYIAGTIHPGVTEREVAWEIERFLREGGSEAMPFDIIVASGPNSALPHAQPSSRAIGASEPIVIDVGARYESYTSDMSRTICIGSRDDTFNRVYDTVLRAQEEAIARIEEGMTGDQADSLSRRVIEQAGYGDAFGHSLGHGIGLATHEQPRLGPRSSDRLSEGAVFTIEPGIYLAGWGGVRLEDDVVMENGKVRVISKAGRTI